MEKEEAQLIIGMHTKESQLKSELRKLSIEKSNILSDFDYEQVEVHNNDKLWHEIVIEAVAVLSK